MKTVIEMALEAGFEEYDCGLSGSELDMTLYVGEYPVGEAVHKLVSLVREDERERDRLMDYAANELNIHAAVLAEREQCAKVCEVYGESVNNEWNKQLGVADDLVGIAEECAAAIRARGKQ